MTSSSRHPTARLAAIELVAKYDGRAENVAANEVHQRLATNDVAGALKADQIRREVLAISGN